MRRSREPIRPRSAACCPEFRCASFRCAPRRSAAARHFDLAALAPAADASLDKAARGTRPVWFDGRWHDATVWSRLDLPVGAVIAAPAVLEQADATIVIDPGLRGRVDRLGNIIVERAP